MAMMPSVVADRVRAVAAALPDDIIWNADGESGREGRVHVTVKYGLHTTNADDVRKVVEDFGPVPIRLGRVRQFHNDDNIVLKVCVDGKRLRELNDLISTKLQCTDRHAGLYRPHMTVAYLKKNDADPYYYRDYFTDELDGEEVMVDEVLYAAPDDTETVIPLETPKVARVASRVAALSPAGALYGFAGWMTLLDDPVTLSGHHNASPAADMVAEFCEANGLEGPNGHWERDLEFPKTRRMV